LINNNNNKFNKNRSLPTVDIYNFENCVIAVSTERYTSYNVLNWSDKRDAK